MLKRFIVFLTLVSLSIGNTFADEGMWLPFLLGKNYEQMKKLGLKITTEQIYSVNNSSLKDAIVNFGNFCTGEVISQDGLILTNHHCGFDAIQSHSSVTNDYITNGFWAMDRSKELSNPGLTVTFLVRMEDVSSRFEGKTDEEQEALLIELDKEYSEADKYTTAVEDFFEGNQKILFVYQIFKDIRLVGAPPSSVGKFGGDTDNWMWPRHTGDFSLFRVYMDKDGKPAEYSKDNVPYHPRTHLSVSTAGVKKNDFSMVMGYPGSTERYMTSYGVAMNYYQSNPAKIKLREKKLALMKEDMDADPKVRIQYASKYARVSNYYKYFIGQNQGLKRLHVIEDKQEEEAAFEAWVRQDSARIKEYGLVLANYKKIYDVYGTVNLPYVYIQEAAFGTEILEFAYKVNKLVEAGVDTKEGKAALAAAADEYFKDYNKSTDQKVFAALLKMYYDDIDKSLHPGIFKEVEKKYKGNFEKYAAMVFTKSMLANKAAFDAFMNAPSAELLKKDVGYICMISILGDFRANVGPTLGSVFNALELVNKSYLKAVLEMRSGEALYPDANFTMRLTYGTVQDYFPKDAVYYNYFTTLEGIIEKEDSTNEEFIVPQKLKELYLSKSYGNYANEEGKLPICFITTNDITGGNSGSPVMNDKGELIGVAFDGNWEAMSGDIIYEPALQRTICVDIRYVLFMIEQYAGAGHLIKEMTLVK
ncbi:MAG: S46 family peptidase [Cytophaga sp.]|uniref:S46 family peptidase n=1 Tax=Cytophaga sp. TaxID=29535 RepID=UPI003F822746